MQAEISLSFLDNTVGDKAQGGKQTNKAYTTTHSPPPPPQNQPKKNQPTKPQHNNNEQQTKKYILPKAIRVQKCFLRMPGTVYSLPVKLILLEQIAG